MRYYAMSTSCLTLSILTVLSVFKHAHAGSPAPLNVTFPENPPASALMNVVEDHFIGVSFELSSFDTLCTCFIQSFVRLLRLITSVYHP